MWGVTIALLFIVLSLWFRWRKKKFSTFKELGIPGPEPSFLFGNVWEMANKTPLKCHQEWIEKYGKVLGFYFGGTPTLLVADIELMKKILIGDFHKFFNRHPTFRSVPPPRKKNQLTSPLTLVRDKRWKEIRRIITPTFTANKMRMMLPIMNNAVDSLMDTIEKKSKTGESFDIYKVYQGLTMDVIGRTAFGIQTDCQNNPDDIILKTSRSLLAIKLKSFFVILMFSFPELGRIMSWISRIMMTIRNKGTNPLMDLHDTAEKILKARRQNKSKGRQDLLQIMIDASVAESDLSKITNEELTAKNEENEESDKSNEINDPAKKSAKTLRYMTDNEILDNCIIFYLAGYETTSTALAFTTHFLLHHPDIQERIREDINSVLGKEGKLDYDTVQKLPYLDQVIAEALRIYPPILYINREANEDVQYGPYKIRKGLSILIPSYNIHHDPDLWPEPEKFDPNRFSPENKANRNALTFEAFGAGPRNCVGMRFAQLEAKLALARILSKYKFVRAENTEKEKITLNISVVTLSPAKGVNLIAVPT